MDVCRRAVEIAEQEFLSSQNASEKDPNAMDTENIAPGTPSKTPGKAVAGPQNAKKGTVSIATIKRAIAEATSTPLAAYLRSLPLASKVFLASLLALIRRTGISEAVLGEVVDEARRLGLLSQLKPIGEYLLAVDGSTEKAGGKAWVESKVAVHGKKGRVAVKKVPDRSARLRGLGCAAVELAEAGIVGLESRRGERVGRIRLGVGEEDVRGALREDEEGRALGFAV